MDIRKAIFEQRLLQVKNLLREPESQEYEACRYELNGYRIISRRAKMTPKKAGQFVTFWKREGKGPIAPFNASDPFDFYVVNIASPQGEGQFIFPKELLIKKGIVSTPKKEGKRGFRVYAKWDAVTSSQAKRTKQWQLEYFYEIT